jgi:FkbM family methyltransferase
MELSKYALRALGHQHWLRFGIRDRAIRAAFSPDKMESTEFSTRFFDLTYTGNLNSFIDWTVYFYGALEAGTLTLLKDLAAATPEPVFVDIGANVGQHSIFMSMHANTVHSFEPNPRVLRQFRELIEGNKLTNITIHPVGLGDKDEVLPFFSPQGANLGTGSFVKEHSPDNVQSGQLQIRNADEYLSGLGLKKIDVMKIDVEGFEKSVLKGMTKTLAKYRPRVVMEFSETTKTTLSSMDELLGLFPSGYKVSLIVELEPVLFFFNKPGYALKTFDFDKHFGNLLFAPQS